jgi:predicted DsbA family dithiol-disulfide isomerase
MHPFARAAAISVQAAKQQGKAWEMHDKLFENYKNIKPETISQFAEQIGLDMEKFSNDMKDPKLAEQVDADGKVADVVGARGTPTFFINGRRLRGARPLSSFEEVIDEELEKANDLLKQGTPIAQVYGKLAKHQKEN